MTRQHYVIRQADLEDLGPVDVMLAVLPADEYGPEETHVIRLRHRDGADISLRDVDEKTIEWLRENAT
jgi:hypothetical protein